MGFKPLYLEIIITVLVANIQAVLPCAKPVIYVARLTGFGAEHFSSFLVFPIFSLLTSEQEKPITGPSLLPWCLQEPKPCPYCLCLEEGEPLYTLLLFPLSQYSTFPAVASSLGWEEGTPSGRQVLVAVLAGAVWICSERQATL